MAGQAPSVLPAENGCKLLQAAVSNDLVSCEDVVTSDVAEAPDGLIDNFGVLRVHELDE